jgi:hypothetical protein
VFCANIGTLLAIMRYNLAQLASMISPIYALTLVSYDEKSTEFYKRLKFVIYSENLPQPKKCFTRLRTYLPLCDLANNG